MAGHAKIVISLRDMPEVLAGLRLEMARFLREAADGEPSTYVRDRMYRVAAAYEAGQREPGGGRG
jgi:hypothetical protein